MQIEKLIQQKMKKVEAYYKFSERGRIGMEIPASYTKLYDGPSLSIKLKPPRFPKNQNKSIKCHRGFFIRSLGKFKHIYSIEDNLYVVSLFTEVDHIEWINNRYDEIIKRVNKLKYGF